MRRRASARDCTPVGVSGAHVLIHYAADQQNSKYCWLRAPRNQNASKGSQKNWSPFLLVSSRFHLGISRELIAPPACTQRTSSLPDGFHEYLVALREQVIAFRKPVAVKVGHDPHYIRSDGKRRRSAEPFALHRCIAVGKTVTPCPRTEPDVQLDRNGARVHPPDCLGGPMAADSVSFGR